MKAFHYIVALTARRDYIAVGTLMEDNVIVRTGPFSPLDSNTVTVTARGATPEAALAEAKAKERTVKI